MEFVKLSDGNKIPIAGFGTYQLTDREICKKAVLDALKVGYSLIDTAESYAVDLYMNQEDKPVINQIEFNSFNQNFEEEKIMREYNVKPEAWVPFAEGKNDIFNNEVLSEIGKKYNKSVVQVILRWLVQRGIIVLTKSTNVDRIKENFDIFNFELSKEDMEKIKTLDTGSSQFFNHYAPETVKMLNNLHRN